MLSIYPGRYLHLNPATGVLTFDPAQVSHLILHRSTTYWQGTNTNRFDRWSTGPSIYDEMPPIANDDNSFGNVVGTNASLNILANVCCQMEVRPLYQCYHRIDWPCCCGFATLTPNVVTILARSLYLQSCNMVLDLYPNPGFTTDPTPINYILTETLTGLNDQALVNITYNEIPPVANDDQSRQRSRQ